MNNETIINGLHVAFAFGGLLAGFFFGAVYGWIAHQDKEAK